MEDRLKWTQKLGISESDLAEWQRSVDPSEEILHWCLLQGKVPETAYLQWAAQNYELPVVRADFFKIPADPVFWDRVRDLQPWNAAFFPLADWQDVLLIGCVQPPEEFRFRHPHRFVLASAQNLLDQWKILNPGAPTTVPSTQRTPSPSAKHIEPPPPVPQITSEPMPTPAPKAAPLTPPVPPRETLVQVPQPAATPQPTLVVASAPEAAPSFEVPDGFSMEGLNIGDDSSPSLSVPGTEPTITGFEMPEGLSFNMEITPTPSLQHELAPDVPTSKAIDDRPEGLTVTFTSSEANFDLASPEPAQSSKTTTLPEMETPSAKVIEFPKSTDESSIVPSRSEPLPMEAAQSEDELIRMALGHITQTFESALAFFMDREVLRPWKWTDNLHARRPDSPAHIELKTPSIFRIVYRTQQPYHGYVTPSATNNDFFGDFYAGVLPKHATLAPILINKTVVGVLMGTTNSDIAYRASLMVMEQIAETVAKRMNELQRKANRTPPPTQSNTR